MIHATGNYFEDLKIAIEAGLFENTIKARPKKAALYEAIEAHNASCDAPKDEAALEDALEAMKEQAATIAALEEAGDEDALGEALLALDAEEDAIEAEAKQQRKAARKAQPSRTPEQIREQAEARIAELAAIAAAVEAQGAQAVADERGTSRGHLAKLLKAHALLGDRPDIREAFLGGLIGFTFLCETAIRRDGLEQIDAILALPPAEARKAARLPRKEAASGSRSPEAIQAANAGRYAELQAIAAAVSERGSKAVAEERGTSLGRLAKLVKAARILAEHSDIREAFEAGAIGYSFLVEQAVRRDGLDSLKARLTA